MMWISTDAVNIFESLLSIVVCCHMKWKLFCPSLGEDKKILVVHWSQGLRLDIDSVPFEKKKKIVIYLRALLSSFWGVDWIWYYLGLKF